tara:strand:+ start:183 stop:506 length:324 start_codon:yes stop_codon:yes gene_type:complete
MTYYSDFNNPAAAQEDDIEIVNGALALARALRDDVVTRGSSPFCCRVFVAGIATTIRTASHRINHVAAGKEVWRFGAYVTETAREDLDALICDYLETAQALVEEGAQ